MRFGFITCVRLGEACIEEILDLGGNLAWMGTLLDEQAQSKSGRVYLDDLAYKHNIPLAKFRNVNDEEAVAAIREADLDWLFIIGWSQIARRPVLEATRRGVLGMHPTLLPEGRGRAAIPWAIIKGLERTGVTLFRLDEGTDTGPILGQVSIPIANDETSTTLYEKVAEAHRALIRQSWPSLDDGTIVETQQDESLATEWPGRRPEDGELSPHDMSSDELDRYVRALTKPYPGAFTRLPDGRVLRIWSGCTSSTQPDAMHVQTRDGWYQLLDYALEG